MVLEWILASVFIVSCISLVGLFFLSMRKRLFEKIVFDLVALAVGAMLGAAFLDVIPEAVSDGAAGNAFLFVLVGIVGFFILEKFIWWRHCHDEKCEVHYYVWLNLFGDAIHNFFDGAIIAAAYIANIPLGVVTTVAVIAHEIPQEIGDFGVLVHGGLTKARALFYNFLTALVAMAGAITAYLFFFVRAESFTPVLLFAAGGFIYMAGVDLMPELHKEHSPQKSVIQGVLIVAGIALIWTVGVLFKGG